MRNLFLRIFLSISLAVMAAFVVGMLIASWARPVLFARSVNLDSSTASDSGVSATNAQTRRRYGWHAERLLSHARNVEWVLSRYGPKAAADFADTIRSTRTNKYLLDRNGREIRGRDVPAEITDINQRAVEADELQVSDGEGVVLAGVPMRDPDGNLFVFALSHGRNTPSFAAYRFWKTCLTLAPVVITLGIVCYFVARYLSNPVLRLRQAVRRFAEGDLEGRVHPSVANRRDELGELAREFDHMAGRTAGLIIGQRRLLQDISHELRSPLARQAVAIELARRGPGPEFEDALDRTAREGQRLNDLVGELLTLTRLEDDGTTIARSPVELDALLTEVVQDADFEAQSRNCSVSLAATEPCEIHGVHELLRRAIENVVRNAVVYTPPGTTVDVSLQVSESEVTVTVRDHGPGVPEAELKDIFRAFHRVSRGRERQTGGAGLGLAITERVVTSHGGSVQARNAPDNGLIVEIRIPRTTERYKT